MCFGCIRKHEISVGRCVNMFYRFGHVPLPYIVRLLSEWTGSDAVESTAHSNAFYKPNTSREYMKYNP